MIAGGVFATLYWTAMEGGTRASTVSYYALIPPIAAFIGNRRIALAATLPLVLGLFYFGAEELQGLLHPTLVRTPEGEIIDHMIDGVVTTLFSFFFSLMMLKFTQMQSHAYHMAHEQLIIQNHALAENGRMKLLGELAAGVAHEINNPLTIVAGNALMLRKRLEKLPDGETLIPFLKQIEEGTQRISKITMGMGALARGSQDAIERVSINPKLLIQGTLDFYVSRLTSHGVQLELVDTTSPKDCVHVNAPQFSQVLMNLLNNALYAVRESEYPKIRVRSEIDGKYWKLQVEDNGPGVPKEVQDRVFKPFFTTKPPGEGTGLGLSLCKRLIHDEKGTLDYARNEPWTIFRIQIPCQEA